MLQLVIAGGGAGGAGGLMGALGGGANASTNSLMSALGGNYLYISFIFNIIWSLYNWIVYGYDVCKY